MATARFHSILDRTVLSITFSMIWIVSTYLIFSILPQLAKHTQGFGIQLPITTKTIMLIPLWLWVLITIPIFAIAIKQSLRLRNLNEQSQTSALNLTVGIMLAIIALLFVGTFPLIWTAVHHLR